ncbi:MAG: DUF1573 domain-containing protein, partial [Calditrichaeota bacterium]|nr:DUF1573 domain-containing protein [Calditrichota bacterium]
IRNSEISNTNPNRDDPQISVDPIELISELLTGENQGFVVEIFNEGDEDLIYTTEIAIIDEPENRIVRGPRRDEPQSRFAFFQDGPAWGGDLGNIVLDQVEGLEYDRFVSDEFADFPIDDYGVLWICHSEQRDPFNSAYNDNRERIEEWVDQGGSYYASTGTNQYNVVPIHPGGLTYSRDGSSNGTVRVSNDPGSEDYNYLAELMDWQQDETVLRGSALFHVHYAQADIDQIENSGWNQVIVSLEGQDVPGIVVYEYGRGYCVVAGTTDGHQHQSFANPPDWGSAGEELCYYLDHLANTSQWVSVDPASGELEPGQSVDMIVTLDATGLIGGEYESEVRVHSNDGENPEVAVSIFLEVTGAPDIDVEWDRDFGYPDVVDWDLAFLDLFIGNPYEISVFIVNIGTDVLSVEAIDFQGGGAEFFSADRVDNFEPMGPGDEEEIILTLNADEAGDYEIVMVVTSDDPDQEDFEVFLHGSPGAPPIINVEPDAIEDEILGAEQHEHLANIENIGESDLRFEIGVEIVAEPDNDRSFRSVRNSSTRSGPFRDDPGDLIAEFAPPNGGVNQYNSGLAWDDDNGFMWITQWNNPYRCVAIDPNDDYQVAAQFNAPGGSMGADYYQGAVYIVNWANRFLFRFDTEGQNLGNLNVPIQPTAISINQEEGWLILEDAGGNRDLIIYDLEDNLQVIGRINNYRNFLNNAFTRSLEWVEAHPDGQLWVNTRRNEGGNTVWQIAVDEDDFQATELVQSFNTFPAGSGQEWDGLGHDGENLWASSYGSNLVRIVDDGVTELNWISIDPMEGQLESEADVDIIVTLDGTGLFGGMYEAEIQLFSNDPENPQVDIFVSLTVEPAPDVFVEWPGEAGFGEEEPLIDWNMFHPDIFTGEVYDVPVTIINDGTDVLIIHDITCEDGHLTADPTDFEVEFGEEAIVNFTFTTDETGEWNEVMTIDSSDPYKEQIEIVLHAEAFDPPIIDVDVNEIGNDLISGENSEHIVNISNIGNAELRWDTNLEIIEGNLRDNLKQRRIRNAGPVADHIFPPTSGIKADDPGWNDGSINGINQNDVKDKYENPPHRDEPSGRGILIAERCGWNNWDFEQYFTNIDGFEYDRFRTWNDVADVDFTDYDIMWIGNYETEAWVANYNRNLERVEEFVDRGGALYHTSGTNFHNTRPINPGGLVYSGNASQNDCPIVLDPEDNFLINYMDENDPFDWDWGIGQRLHGSGNAHGTFLERQLDDIDNSDWYEVMAVGNPLDEPILVTYQYGQGFCLVGTILDGYLHARPQEFQWGRTGEAVIWYLDFLSGFSRWVTWEPSGGSLEPEADIDIVVTLDATGLYTGLYEADLHILSNDPENSDVVVSISLDVTGFPLADITWPESWGHPDIAVWNESYDELYAGGPYSLPFNFKNVGTDELTIIDVESNLGVFTTDWDPETQSLIPPGEQTIVNITFNSDEDNVYDAFVTATFGDDVEPIEIWVSAESFSPPILIVEPDQIQVDLPTGDMREFIVDLVNDGEADLRWWSDKLIIEEPEDARDNSSRRMRSTSADQGPKRDELGDQLGIYGWDNAGANRYKNAAYDHNNEWMWLATYSPNWIKAISFDEDYENFNDEVEDFQPGGNPMDIAWLDGRLFVIHWANQALYRYDADGNNLGEINFQFRPCGVGASFEMGLLFVQEDNPNNNRDIHVLQMNEDGEVEEQIGLIDNYRPLMGNQWSRNVEWVDDHPDGQLWVHTSTRELHQFSIDTNDWQAIDRVQVLQNFGGNQEYGGVAHDMNNLWHGGWDQNEYVIIDDGVEEIRWLSWEEKSGLIESGESEDVIVTINSDGLIAGDYIADLNIYSNDPDFPNDIPDVAIRITLSVVGVPNIIVLPGGDGFDPLDFERVYFGYPTSRIVTVFNDGTDDLEISEVISDGNPDCYVEEDDIANLIIRPGAEAPLNIWYNADPERPGVQEARLRFMTNVEDWEEGYPLDVIVSEGAMESPVLEIDPQEFGIALNEGDAEEVVTNVSNTGGSTLWFSTDTESIREPGDERDDGLHRRIRSVEQSIIPGRDLPADWISVDPAEGEIDAGGDLDVVFIVDSDGLMGGEYVGNVHFLSNDPENPDQIVTVTLDVTGIPRVGGDPIPFPFDGAGIIEFEGVFYVGQEYAMDIEIINEGSEVTNIIDIDVNEQNNWSFRVPRRDVPARSSITAELVFEPGDVGEFEVVVMLTTNAPNAENGEIWWEAIGSAVLPPIIALEVPGINDEEINVSMMLEDEPEEMILSLSAANGDRDNLTFNISSEGIEEERDLSSRSIRGVDNKSGPVRDDPGDILAQMQVPFSTTSGMAFDGEMLWGCSYSNDRLMSVDINELEVVLNINIHDQPMSMTFDGENLWVGQWSNETVRIYDLEGEMIEQFNLGFRQMAGMGSDREEFVYINSLDNRTIRIISIEDREQVGVINYQAAMNNAEVWGIDWVPDHQNGQLWGNSINRMYQVFVSENGNAEAVQNFGTNADQPYVGPCHDGDNIWHGMWGNQTWYMRDDGVDEGLFWLTIDPTEGELEPGADMDIFLTFSTEELEDETTYSGILIIESNDPVDPEIIIGVSLQTGVSGLQHFDDFQVTDVSHSVIVNELSLDNEAVVTGWEVGAFTPDGVLSGAAVWIEGERLGLAIWGDDDNNQFTVGERISYLVWDAETNMEYTPRVVIEDGPVIWIPNSLTILSLLASSERELSIETIEGWNTISLNIDPLNYYQEGEPGGPFIPDMFNNFTDEDDNQLVELLKDDYGHFWTPEWNFLNIPFWNLMDGYKVKVTEDSEFTIEGAPIAASSSILLYPGWNYMAYYPTYDLDASSPDFYVLAEIIEDVSIAKDNWGNFMSPNFNFSNMNPWTEGQGYQVKISGEASTTHHYPAPQ